MPVMQQPEAYLGHVNDDSFDEDGKLKEGPLKGLVEKLAHAFAEWVTTIHEAPRASVERTSPRLKLRQRHPALAHIFAGAVGVAGLAALIALRNRNWQAPSLA